MLELKNGIEMNVGKTLIAETEDIPVDKVCCINCDSCAKHTSRYYCRFLRKAINNADSDFCSFFFVEED